MNATLRKLIIIIVLCDNFFILSTKLCISLYCKKLFSLGLGIPPGELQ